MWVRVRCIRGKTNSIAYTSGFLFWKSINLSSYFFTLPGKTRDAILAHEVGHIAGFHIEKRLLCFIICPFLLFWLCRKQELWADEFAARHGHAKALIDGVLAEESCGGKTHPSHEVRRKNLEKYV